VLGWTDSTSFTNGAPADLVLGQPDFNTVNCNSPAATGGGFNGFTNEVQTPNAASLCVADVGLGFAGFAVDPSGNVWVADSENARVLRFPSPFTSGKTAGESADIVLGQPDFVSNGG